MSRNGTGTYNLPAGNPVVTGTTISSTWANNTLADMANAITGSIAADGQTPITGALIGTSGTVAFGGVGQTRIPSGTTAQRAATPLDGMIRYNTDIQQYEGYKNGAWSIFGNGAGGTLFSDTVTATQGQTVINTPTGYVLGGDNLSVYVNGSRQIYNVNYTETTTSSFTFVNGLNVGDLVNYTIGASTSLSVNASSVLYNEGGTGAVNQNLQQKLQEFVSVLDFGADPTGVADATTAFTNAQTASKNIYVPPGTYKLNGLRIQNGVTITGAGEWATYFNQATAGTPAINCTSDVTVGQLRGLRLTGFSINGFAGATVAAMLVEANGVYAVENSTFEFGAFYTYRALETQCATANAVYHCNFKVTSENTTNTAVLLNGGAYNNYDFFLVQTLNGRAISETGFNNTFTRLVTEGQIASSGQNTVFINPSIEEWAGTSLPTEAAFSLSGFNQNLINPTLILNTANSAKVGYAFATFSQTVLNAPRILVDGAVLLNPFAASGYLWTLIGPGQNECGNKIETIYDNADASKNLRSVSFVGDCSQFTLNPVPHGGKSIQYLAPAGSFNLTIQNNTDAMIINGSGTIAVANVGYGYSGQTSYINGQTLSIWTANAITTFTFFSTVAGVDTTLFPATLTANQKITYIYHSVTNKFYPI